MVNVGRADKSMKSDDTCVELCILKFSPSYFCLGIQIYSVAVNVTVKYTMDMTATATRTQSNIIVNGKTCYMKRRGV